MPVSAGIPAPDFTLQDENGEERTLSEFRGSPVVLYFYPKDDTPGCTTEACNFRDDYSAYDQSGVRILGVSPDTPKSHTNREPKTGNREPYFDHAVCDLYGVWGPKKFMGREYQGVLRTTFLIDKDGQIAQVFENVKPADHSAEILEALQSV